MDVLYAVWKVFLSTLSLRRATAKTYSTLTDEDVHFYPRSPCGERPQHPACRKRKTAHFYPRSPCGERRQHYGSFRDLTVISIHAILAESDVEVWSTVQCSPYISIHALLAESDARANASPNAPKSFLSTLSLRRATLSVPLIPTRVVLFLSTLSLRRATTGHSPPAQRIHHFYPRSPCGERRPARCSRSVIQQISIHALLAESDC